MFIGHGHRLNEPILIVLYAFDEGNVSTHPNHGSLDWISVNAAERAVAAIDLVLRMGEPVRRVPHPR